MFRRACLLAVLLAAACVRVEAYACVADDDCVWQPDGVCEPTGYCSYPDPECESHRRYSALAGSYARQCTEVLVGTTEPDPSSSTSTSSTSSSESSEGPMRVTETSTGQTTMPGDLVWSFIYVGDVPGNDVFWAVEAIDDVEFIVAGHTHTLTGGRDVLLARYRGENEIWLDAHDTDGGEDEATSMVRGPDGALYLAGDRTTAGDIAPWVGRYETDGDEVWVAPLTGNTSYDVACGLGGFVAVVGRTAQTSAFVSTWRTWNEFDWDHVLASPPDAWLQAVAARGSDFWIAGQLGTDAYLARAAEAGLQPFAFAPSEKVDAANIQALAMTADAIFAVGWVSTLDADYQGWIVRFDLEGSLVWDDVEGEEGDDELEALVVRDDDVVAVGYRRGLEDRDVWVASWSKDGGDPRWSQPYDDLDRGDDIARDVALMAGGDLIVVGELQGPDGDKDAFAARLVP